MPWDKLAAILHHGSTLHKITMDVANPLDEPSNRATPPSSTAEMMCYSAILQRSPMLEYVGVTERPSTLVRIIKRIYFDRD